MRQIGYNLLTTVILLILVELGLRLFDFEFALAPPRVEFGFPNPVEMEMHFAADPDVLWAPPEYYGLVDLARGWQPSIVFMGDSCTHLGTYDEELQSIIAARDSSTHFTFMNVGISGWSSWSGLQQLQRDVLPMRPRAITIYYGWNDHWKNFGVQDKDAGRLMEATQSSAWPSPSELRIVQLVNRAWWQLKRQSFDVFSTSPHLEDAPYRVSLVDYRANLRQMVRIARANGIIPILLTAPTSHRLGEEPAHLARRWMIDLEDLVPLHRQHVQVTREVAAEEDAPLVDLYAEFNRLPRPDLERSFKEDGIHLTPEGDRRIAELIDRHLVQAGLYQQILGGAEADKYLEETLDNARRLASNRFDVYLDGNWLLYVKERCDDSEETFFLHAQPADPNDFAGSGNDYGFENLNDFNLSQARLDFMPRCVAARPLPDYPVATIQTGQYYLSGETIVRVWEEEFDLME